MAHSLQERAGASSVLVPKNPQWDQNNYKSNTVNGKVGKHEQRGVRKAEADEMPDHPHKCKG